MLALKNDIDMKMTMSYHLGPVSWTLATADGSPVKSDKAKLLHNLEGTIEASEKPVQEDTVYIYDGHALLQAMTAIPDTFEEVAERVFTLLPKTQRVDFVTDSYYEHSIKAFERRCRGMSTTFLLSGPRTKTPREWKSFISNDENKTQLIKLLLSEWKKPKCASRLRRRQLFFVCGEECFCLSSDDGIVVQALPEEDLFSSQEEADTRIILHCSHVARKFPTTFVIAVRSPDTDVLVLLSKYSQNIDHIILFDTGMVIKEDYLMSVI